jgi:hypothetical protein
MYRMSNIVGMTAISVIVIIAGGCGAIPSDVEEYCMTYRTTTPEWQNVKVSKFAKGKPNDDIARNLNPKEIYCVECQMDVVLLKDEECPSNIFCLDTPYKSDKIIVKAGNKGKKYTRHIVYRTQSGIVEGISQSNWDSVCPFKAHEDGEEVVQADRKECYELVKKCRQYHKERGVGIFSK